MLACLKTAEVTAAAFKGSRTSGEKNIGSSFRAKNYIFTANRFAVFFQKNERGGRKKTNPVNK